MEVYIFNQVYLAAREDQRFVLVLADGRIDSQGAHHVHQIAFCKSEDASWTVNGVSDTSPLHCLECHVLEVVIEIRARGLG